LIDYAVEFVPEGSFATIEDGVPRRRWCSTCGAAPDRGEL